MTISRVVLFITVILTAPLVASSKPTTDLDQAQHVSHSQDVPSTLVEKVRKATEPFLDIRNATDYDQFLGCVSGPQEGAMGVHFVNFPLVGDGKLDVDHPEALIYETKNGGFRLVGVEYIVMADAWHANHADPPVLEGQTFQFTDTPNRFALPPFYELHVWAWRDNPNGAFVDWNTRVSCEGR